MTKLFTAALVAASVFGASAAFASGEYYVGGTPDAVKSQNVDPVRTHSIGDRVAVRDTTVEYKNTDRGDYRPMVPAANAN